MYFQFINRAGTATVIGKGLQQVDVQTVVWGRLLQFLQPLGQSHALCVKQGSLAQPDIPSTLVSPCTQGNTKICTMECNLWLSCILVLCQTGIAIGLAELDLWENRFQTQLCQSRDVVVW